MLNKILKFMDFLIQQDTQNPPRKISKDDKLFNKLTNHFKAYSFTIELTDLGDGHVIFYAKKGKPDVLFNVHLDTVPVIASTIEQWHYDPFSMTIDNQKVYGRGSCDIKGAAAILMVLAETAENLALVFTTDEEGANGCCVQSFIKNNDLSAFKQVIIAEPTNSAAVVSHRGYLSVYSKFIGVCGHSSMSIALQSNAIHKANKWLTQALDYAQGFVSKDNPAGICFNVGVIKGGEKNNMIAAAVKLDFSARVPSGLSSKHVFEELKALDDQAQWRVGMMAPSLPADGKNDKNSLKFCTKNSIQVGNTVDFWTEAALFSQAGLPAIVLGPGDIQQAHTIDEWVRIDELEKTYEIYKKVINS
ncbi:MAG: acetylornithine deacetylase [Proteobacteria bacterium]|nr:acetylornithine deacetylase [Pseudomonadota bacterium]